MAAIFQTTFSNTFSWYENIQISIKISLKFVPKGPINNIPALVQIMAWVRSGDKPLSEPMMDILLTHICVTQPQWVKLKDKNNLNPIWAWFKRGFINLEFEKGRLYTWRPHQMKTFSALLAFCAGNSPVTGGFPPHKGQWRRALIFSSICAWRNSWANNGDASSLRCHHTHYDVIVMK